MVCCVLSVLMKTLYPSLLFLANLSVNLRNTTRCFQAWTNVWQSVGTIFTEDAVLICPMMWTKIECRNHWQRMMCHLNCGLLTSPSWKIVTVGSAECFFHAQLRGGRWRWPVGLAKSVFLFFTACRASRTLIHRRGCSKFGYGTSTRPLISTNYLRRHSNCKIKSNKHGKQYVWHYISYD